ncbi:MAG: helix-turn-helix transcriptional regulator [Peptococcaceae bacterium]|nr:helix-turn-helix transcriptional regulator [Peptococcaceae bacterium]
MEQLSHVDNLAAQMQRLVAGSDSVVALARESKTNSGTIRRIEQGYACRLKTIEKLARCGGRCIGEMFLTPDVNTDWYKETALQYLPDNLEAFTNEAELTLSEISERLGVPHQIYQLYLKGGQYPQTNTLQKIADVLEIEVADLFLPPMGGDRDDK